MKKILSVFAAVIILAVVFCLTFTVFADDPKNGFVREGDGVYYYENDTPAYFRWVKWNGNMYYVDGDGKVIANQVYEVYDEETGESASYFFNSKGVMQSGGFVKYVETINYDDGTTYSYTSYYYAYADGKLARGWTKIGDYTYYFEDYGYNPCMKYGGSCWVNDYYYVFTKGGILKQGGGWVTYTETYTDGTKQTNYYYTTKTGKVYTGWKEIGGNKYYFSPYGGEMYTGIRTINDRQYYFTEKGVLKTGWIKHSGDGWSEYYCATKTGILLRGWQTIGGKKYYFSDSEWDPYMYKDGTHEINGKTYLFNTNGVLMTGAGIKKITYKYDDGYSWTSYYLTYKNGTVYEGWKKINGNYYYFGPEMYRGEGTTINKKVYVFNKNGTLVKSSGWFKVSESYKTDAGKEYTVTNYWYLVKGVPKTGWQKLSGKWYYFDTHSGRMYKNGGFSIKKGETSTAYVFEANGVLTKRTGWLTFKSASGEYTYKYYVVKNGIAKTGWKKFGNNSYYFYEDGEMATGVTTVYNKDGSHKTYFFKNNGVLATDKTGWVKETYSKDSADYYYFIKGVAKTGGKVINGNTYYFSEYGYMYKNATYEINGKYYTFRANGTLVK